MKTPRKHFVILGFMVVLVFTLASSWAYAQSDDLIKAASKGELRHVKALLAAKVDANAKDADGITALIWASMNGHLEVVLALIDAKADVNAKADDGVTALIWASKNGHLEVVRALIDAKADVNAKADDGVTALICASHEGHQEIVQLIKNKREGKKFAWHLFIGFSDFHGVLHLRLTAPLYGVGNTSLPQHQKESQAPSTFSYLGKT